MGGMSATKKELYGNQIRKALLLLLFLLLGNYLAITWQLLGEES
jgi:hypothetical protein